MKKIDEKIENNLLKIYSEEMSSIDKEYLKFLQFMQIKMEQLIEELDLEKITELGDVKVVLTFPYQNAEMKSKIMEFLANYELGYLFDDTNNKYSFRVRTHINNVLDGIYMELLNKGYFQEIDAAIQNDDGLQRQRRKK